MRKTALLIRAAAERMMRVITGTARGRRLNAPEGLDVRPTTDKVKEAIFSAIQFEIENAYVLDLFAGSGQMGISNKQRCIKGCFCGQFAESHTMYK